MSIGDNCTKIVVAKVKSVMTDTENSLSKCFKFLSTGRGMDAYKVRTS